MGAGVWNLFLGIAAVVAGASGQFSLVFTNSSTLLMVFGGVIAAYGIFQIVRARRRE